MTNEQHRDNFERAFSEKHRVSFAWIQAHRADIGYRYDHPEIQNHWESYCWAIADMEKQAAPVGWQSRYLDRSEELEGWSSWKHVDTCGLGFWQKRVAEDPQHYQVRPIYAAPVAQLSEPPEGWKYVLVNSEFNSLIDALQRAESKGYMPDAMFDEWTAFNWLPAAPTTTKDAS